MNNIKLFILFILLTACSCVKKELVLINAHAHNDYEHDRPLFEALENKFISVEVDVHLINGDLYISHDTPTVVDSAKTLELLYLKPLLNRINLNKGKVYKNYDGFFYLMVDIKTEASASYSKLKTILKDYESIISRVVSNEEEKNKPIKIVITGHKGRPFNQILEDEPKLVTLDGRFNELGRNIPAEIMPYISENYKNHLSYSGEGEPSIKDRETLFNMVKATHREGKKLRFWASPDNEAVWTFLLKNKVDLINTDSLPKFNKYMSKRIN